MKSRKQGYDGKKFSFCELNESINFEETNAEMVNPRLSIEEL